MTRRTEVLSDESNEFSRLIPLKWLLSTGLRLDASYYAREVFSARRILERWPHRRVDELVQRVFNLTRFKRVYAVKESGVPYLSPSEALLFRPSSERFLSKSRTEDLEQYLACEGWALLTCSGTVGRIVYVDDRLSSFAFTHDLIRIVPRDDTQMGYLCAYLSSWIGQALLTKDQYGAAVKHLEAHHVNSVPVPLLPEGTRQAIDKNILKAYGLREQANILLDKAQELLHVELDLRPIVLEELAEDSMGFAVPFSELGCRFDASYHNPVVRSVIRMLRRVSAEKVQLGSVCEIFLPDRFKRIYVGKTHGLPFLQPAHLVEIRPYDLKFVSKTKTEGIEKLVVRKNWAVMARSGTIGRIAIVTSEYEGWCGSDDLLRIIPKDEEINIGYVVSFLMSRYGICQFVRETYGGVIGHIEKEHLEQMLIPRPSARIQEKIGDLVVRAFELKAEANALEVETIANIEEELVRPGQVPH